MVKAELSKQLMIFVDDTVGTLSEIMSFVSGAGINFVAMCAYAMDTNVAIMFVTDDNNAAKQLLSKHHYDVREEEVILLSLDNKPGSLQTVLDKVAEAGIDLTLVYGSVDNSAEVCRIVLISKNNLDATMVIKTQLERS